MEKYLKNKVAILIFTLPALLIFTVIVFYPIMQTFYRSMFDWDGLNTAKFIFFENYKSMLQDDIFYITLKNGFIFAVIISIFQICMATFLALAITSNNVLGRGFLRTSFFVPVVLSITVVCQLWLAIYNGQYGLLNKLFQVLGLSYQQGWLDNESTAIFAVAATNAWQYMGYHFAILTAGIKSIPEHYYEAARIDGASKAKAHLAITMPLLQESYRLCLILAVTGGLNAFANMFIMTNGGPGNATYSLTYMMYRSAFRMNEFGYGCANAAVLVLECLVVTILINRLVARERITY